MKLQNCHGNIPYTSAPRWRQSFKILYKNEDIRAFKDALENLDTRKSTPRKILTGILLKNSENSEVKPNLSCKLLTQSYSSVEFSIDTIKPVVCKEIISLAY